MGSFRQKSVEAELADAIRRNRCQQVKAQFEELASVVRGNTPQQAFRPPPPQQISPKFSRGDNYDARPPPLPIFKPRSLTPSSSAPQLHAAGSTPMAKFRSLTPLDTSPSQQQRLPNVRATASDHAFLPDQLQPRWDPFPQQSALCTDTQAADATQLPRQFEGNELQSGVLLNLVAQLEAMTAERDVHLSSVTFLASRLEATTKERDELLQLRLEDKAAADAAQKSMDEIANAAQRSREEEANAAQILMDDQCSLLAALSIEKAVSKASDKALVKAMQRRYTDLERERDDLKQRLESLSELPEAMLQNELDLRQQLVQRQQTQEHQEMLEDELVKLGIEHKQLELEHKQLSHLYERLASRAATSASKLEVALAASAAQQAVSRAANKATVQFVESQLRERADMPEPPKPLPQAAASWSWQKSRSKEVELLEILKRM